jgi:hypothetical protein
MRLDVVPDNILERLVLLMGIVPTPMVQVSWGMASASTIIAGSRLGLFEALDGVELSPAELAARLDTHPLATETLLNALCGFGCIDRSDGRYRNSEQATKWLVPGSKDSLHDAVGSSRMVSTISKMSSAPVRSSTGTTVATAPRSGCPTCEGWASWPSCRRARWPGG